MHSIDHLSLAQDHFFSRDYISLALCVNVYQCDRVFVVRMTQNLSICQCVWKIIIKMANWRMTNDQSRHREKKREKRDRKKQICRKRRRRRWNKKSNRRRVIIASIEKLRGNIEWRSQNINGVHTVLNGLYRVVLRNGCESTGNVLLKVKALRCIILCALVLEARCDSRNRDGEHRTDNTRTYTTSIFWLRHKDSLTHAKPDTSWQFAAKAITLTWSQA